MSRLPWRVGAKGKCPRARGLAWARIGAGGWDAGRGRQGGTSARAVHSRPERRAGMGVPAGALLLHSARALLWALGLLPPLLRVSVGSGAGLRVLCVLTGGWEGVSVFISWSRSHSAPL